MAAALPLFLTASLLLLLTLFVPIISSSSSSSPANTTSTSQFALVRSVCRCTPYPNSCLESLNLSAISITINPSILNIVLQSLQSAITQATKLSSLLSNSNGIVEAQRGALQDCRELQAITVSSLKKSTSLLQQSKIGDVRIHLSAALTNKNTCLEGLEGSSGPLKPALVASVVDAYQYVSNSLSLVSGKSQAAGGRLRKEGFPKWIEGRQRRLLQSGGGAYDPGSVVTVAADGSGNFTTISDAIWFAPNNSDERSFIIVRQGVYEEHVDIPIYKTNIVLLGEGSDVTVIRGNRSVGDGWTTFRSATVAVSGQGFLARDIGIQNVAGAPKHQAVALRVNADLAALYRCTIDGYQDTLYVHSFRQFYRECNIFGTVDFIFGNAAVIFQAGNMMAKAPMQGQYNAITAQSKDDPSEVTGIVIQNCSILAYDDLATNTTKTYLGRPWKPYATTVYMESYIDDLVDPTGWTEWSADQEELDTLYYGEYLNSGPGAGTDQRVTWPGFHVMVYDDAYSFTVSNFIYSYEWLDSTSFPYYDGV